MVYDVNRAYNTECWYLPYLRNPHIYPTLPFFYNIPASVHFHIVINLGPVLALSKCRALTRCRRSEWRRRGLGSVRVTPRLDHFRAEAYVMTLKNLSGHNKRYIQGPLL